MLKLKVSDILTQQPGSGVRRRIQSGGGRLEKSLKEISGGLISLMEMGIA